MDTKQGAACSGWGGSFGPYPTCSQIRPPQTPKIAAHIWGALLWVRIGPRPSHASSQRALVPSPTPHRMFFSCGNPSLFISGVEESAGSLKADGIASHPTGEETRVWRVGSLAGKVTLLTRWRGRDLDPGGQARSARTAPWTVPPPPPLPRVLSFPTWRPLSICHSRGLCLSFEADLEHQPLCSLTRRSAGCNCFRSSPTTGRAWQEGLPGFQTATCPRFRGHVWLIPDCTWHRALRTDGYISDVSS